MCGLGDFERGVTLSIGAQSMNVYRRVFWGQEVALPWRVGVIISVLQNLHMSKHDALHLFCYLHFFQQASSCGGILCLFKCTFAHNGHSGLRGTPVPHPALNLQTLNLEAACSLERLVSAYDVSHSHSRVWNAAYFLYTQCNLLTCPP